MAATIVEAMELLLFNFDQIYEDCKSGIEEIQLLKSNGIAEMKNRGSLECTLNSLRSENERLTKVHIESLNNLAYQLERRNSCQSLKEELRRACDEHAKKENEYRNAIESLKQDHTTSIKDLERQVCVLLTQKVANEETINQLHQDLAAQRNHTEAIKSKLEQIYVDGESRYDYEIQDLKDCLVIEQEEKNELNKKLQDLEKELLVSRTKLVERQQDLSSGQHVETLKQKIMKLRKENGAFKRQLGCKGVKEF